MYFMHIARVPAAYWLVSLHGSQDEVLTHLL